MNRMLHIFVFLLCSFLALCCKKDESNPIQPTNNAPSTPSNPSPVDGATGESRSPVLSWTCSDPDAGDSVKYDIYFSSVNPPNTLATANWVNPNYALSGLDTNRTYYWRVTAKDSKGASTVGPIWHFATMSGSQSIPLEFTNWKCYIQTIPQYVAPAPGVYERVADGLKIYGSGYRGGALLHPTPLSRYPITNKTIYVRWKANGGGDFMGVFPITMFTDSVAWVFPYYPTNLTTHHSYLSSYVIAENLWYYTRCVLTSTSYTTTTATGNYDNLGGTVVQTKTASLDHNYQYFGFGIVDTYAGTTPYAILGEARIE